MERKGSEPSVPHRIDDAFETALFASAALPVPPERPARFARGTGSSNPLCSSGESLSAVTFSDCRDGSGSADRDCGGIGLSRALVHDMMRQKWGRIVNVTTSLGTMTRARPGRQGSCRARGSAACSCIRRRTGTASRCPPGAHRDPFPRRPRRPPPQARGAPHTRAWDDLPDHHPIEQHPLPLRTSL